MTQRTCQVCGRSVPLGDGNCPFCGGERSGPFTASRARFSTPPAIWWLLNGTVIFLLLLNVIVLALPAQSGGRPAPRVQPNSAPIPKTFADVHGRVQIIATSDLFFPCISLGVMYVFTNRATSALQKAGIQVGLLGANLSTVP